MRRSRAFSAAPSNGIATRLNLASSSARSGATVSVPKAGAGAAGGESAAMLPANIMLANNPNHTQVQSVRCWRINQNASERVPVGLAIADSAPSIASRRSFVVTPPGAEKPPLLPPAARTR